MDRDTYEIAAAAASKVEALDLKDGDILLVSVGIEAMGEGLGPWIPGPQELEYVRDNIARVVPDGVQVFVISHRGVMYQIVRGLDTDNAVVVEAIPDEGSSL